MRTIESPGVEIFEREQTLNTELPVGTTVFAMGYATQGPTDELINITSNSEFDRIYGEPVNAAEKYFANTAKQVLGARGNLITTRLPYGSGSGNGFTANYSALVYPVFPFDDSQLFYLVSSTFNNTYIGLSAWPSSPGNLTFNVSSTVDVQTFAGWASTTNFGINTTNTNALSVLLPQAATAPNVTLFKYNASTYPLLSANNDELNATVVNLVSTASTYTIEIQLSAAVSQDSEVQFNLYTQFETITATTLPNLTDTEDYYIGQPYHLSIDETTYNEWIQGGINWKNILTNPNTVAQNVSTAAGVGYAGMVVINKAKTTIDDDFTGYYIAIADNTKTDKGSEYDVTTSVKTINNTTASNDWLTLNDNRLGFALTGSFTEHQGSISEVVETVPSFDFAKSGVGGFDDSIIVTLFRVRPSIYSADDRILDNVLYESYVGSFDSTRTIQNQNGGSPVDFFLENKVNANSSNLQLFINPNISRNSGSWIDTITGEPVKSVRVKMGARANTDSTVAVDPAQPNGAALYQFNALNASNYMSNADNLYAVGEYVSCQTTSQKLIGNLPAKVLRAITLADNRELLRVDMLTEAGLGTIWTGTQLNMNNWPAGTTNPVTTWQNGSTFDDTVYINGIINAHAFDADSDGLLDQETGSSSEASDLYETIYNIFNSFCSTTRKDCIFIADPLRYIFVQGDGTRKVLDDKTKNFSQHIYWPLKNLYAAGNSSYSCTYANWFKVNDITTGKFMWAPPSGYIANIMIKVDTNQFPWFAPAGLNRGIIEGIVDIGINPTQRQRDLLYKSGLNPTVFWPGDGYVVWGQKTLLATPSAFDRINVRRLFLWLEKATLRLTRYFVFEQNTPFTRERLKTTLRPIFDFAKNNQGVYDYLIVCDERNNTPDVIDRNELIVDIYIKPTRVAEFILVNFVATRTGQDFNELI